MSRLCVCSTIHFSIRLFPAPLWLAHKRSHALAEGLSCSTSSPLPPSFISRPPDFDSRPFSLKSCFCCCNHTREQQEQNHPRQLLTTDFVRREFSAFACICLLYPADVGDSLSFFFFFLQESAAAPQLPSIRDRRRRRFAFLYINQPPCSATPSTFPRRSSDSLSPSICFAPRIVRAREREKQRDDSGGLRLSSQLNQIDFPSPNSFNRTCLKRDVASGRSLSKGLGEGRPVCCPVGALPPLSLSSLAHCLQSWLKRKNTICVGHRDLFNYETALRLFEQSEQFHNCSDCSE